MTCCCRSPGTRSVRPTPGIDDLIALDPNAHWDTSANKLITNIHPSPRLTILPVFDPVYYAVGVTQGRYADLKVANYIGFFIETRQGNNVTGRITPVTGILKGSLGAAPVGSFAKVIRLVE